MDNPVQVLIEKQAKPLEHIKQFFVQLQEEGHKIDCLKDIYDKLSIGTSFIFTASKPKAELITEKMREKGYAIDYLHGDMNQLQRNESMEKFRSGATRILVTTDILARGIDVQSVSYVFNYDMPSSIEYYVHRIGRCARFGRKGVAISFLIDGGDKKPRDIIEIERFTNSEIKFLPDLTTPGSNFI
mgnify:FL=1